ncbi:hypothetical protein OEA41_005556 [Lepraria neglecta]|uniref:GH16 domain-containing protein n=1 Tax=Lepraria neglecta TaxID=209136 RepID=A0AAE0DQ89_9LECA|nr:hypothetical protein OEA41_005556 [Lepraria neglecta]
MYVDKYAVAAFAAVVSLPLSFAQVTTGCQPLNSTCPPDVGLATSSYFVDFTKVTSLPIDWSVAAYETVEFGPNGAELAFAKRYDAPLIRTNFNFLFGRIDYVVQTAPGVGIASCMVLLSDDLDEIDWEFLGGAGNSAETNYWGKGFLDYRVAEYVGVTSPTTQFHTYSIEWSATSLSWIIDGETVRTVTAAQAGNIYPQTPMKVSLSLWDGGDPSEPAGTRAWAGGNTPIPPPENYTMFIKSVSIQNANPAEQYQYTDETGSWQSIKMFNKSAPLFPNVFIKFGDLDGILCIPSQHWVSGQYQSYRFSKLPDNSPKLDASRKLWHSFEFISCVELNASYGL